LAHPYLAIRYGFGSIATGLYASVPGVLLLYYMTEVLLVPASWAATAIFLPKFAGAFLDPIAGWLSDRTQSAYGRRFPWMLAGGMAFAGCLGLVFSGIAAGSPMTAFAFVVCAYFLSAVGYSAFAVPYLALAAEVTEDPLERVSIVSRRMVFVMLGIMLGSAAAPMLVSLAGGGVSGYRQMGAVVAALSFGAILVTLHLVSGMRESLSGRSDDSNWRDRFALVFSDRAYRRLLLIFAIQTLGGTVFLALLPYVVKFVWLGEEAEVGLLMLLLLLSSTAALSLWEAVARRRSPEHAFVGAAALSVAAYAALFLLQGSGGMVGRGGAFMLLGIAFAGVQLLPFAMAAERIHRSVQVTGVRCEAAFTGVWTSVEKLALSLGAPIAATVIGISGSPDADSGLESAGGALLLGAIAVPVVGQCLSVVLLVTASQISGHPRPGPGVT